jgi:hypothetical protein
VRIQFAKSNRIIPFRALDEGNYGPVSILDLSSAFDVVNID